MLLKNHSTGRKITLKIQYQSVNISNNRKKKKINVNFCRESEANKAKYAKQMAEQKKDAESSVRFYNQTCFNFDKFILCTCLWPVTKSSLISRCRCIPG